MNSTAIKQVVEVKIGHYQMTLDEDKMGLLDSLCNDSKREYDQIQEMTDWLLDLCCQDALDDGACMKYMKYLKNIRGAFDYMKSLGVTKI